MQYQVSLRTVANVQPGQRLVSFWVLRFILPLVVDNCMLWYLFQEDHVSYINCAVQVYRLS